MKKMTTICCLEQVNDVIIDIKDSCVAYHVPLDKMLDIQLCLMEALNNAIIHGNQGDGAKQVQICWQLERGRFYFDIEDEGEGIAIADREKKLINPLDLFEENGRGIFLMSQLLNRMWYNERGNRTYGEIHWSTTA